MQAQIKTPPISLINKETDDVSECELINIKMRRNLSDANLETHKLKIATFENSQPEEFLALVNNFKTTVDVTGTMSAAGTINYIRTLLSGDTLHEFDELASQNTGTSNAHLKFIQEGLPAFFKLAPFPRRSV